MIKTRKRKIGRTIRRVWYDSPQEIKCSIAFRGERRRVEIARALAATPHFILLDEPFTGIDPIAIGDIKENIYKLAREKGLGVLITDHNPKATLSITDRAYVIFDGKN